jgi:hypothetical protein
LRAVQIPENLKREPLPFLFGLAARELGTQRRVLARRIPEIK